MSASRNQSLYVPRARAYASHIAVPPGSIAIVQSWQRHATVWVLLALISVAVAWDVYVAFNGVHSDTISEFTLSFLWFHPSVAAAVGYIMGHLTWPRNDHHISQMVRSAVVIVGACLLGVLDFVLHAIPTMPPIAPFALFVPLGHFFWPQILEA